MSMNEPGSPGNPPATPSSAYAAVREAARGVNHAHAQLRAARRTLFGALRLRAQLGGRQIGQCGTPAGYRRHQRHGSVTCDACIEAWSWSKKAAA